MYMITARNGKVMFLHLCVILFTGGIFVWEVYVRETPHTVTSGPYASYWNAFLLNIACDARKDMVSKLTLMIILPIVLGHITEDSHEEQTPGLLGRNLHVRSVSVPNG